jgi:hypothetical protein
VMQLFKMRLQIVAMLANNNKNNSSST